MRILALQLKRIGDLILTTPALAALRAAQPDAHITLAVHESCASLVPAIGGVNSFAVFGRGRGFAPWQQALSGPWDACLDFTGTDRSALATAASRARRRIAFEWVRARRLRAVAYGEFIDSSVRERHTVDHYLDLACAVVGEAPDAAAPALQLDAAARASAGKLLSSVGLGAPFALVHPGTARPEKFWLAERWAAVIAHLKSRGLAVVLTCGPDPAEQEHARAIVRHSSSVMLLPPDLLALAALVERAAIVLSCDTSVVHLAAAFARPQLALFGPTNPFHWRPRHPRAAVISAARADAPLTDFTPRMRGAPMDGISTELVIRVTDSLLSSNAFA